LSLFSFLAHHSLKKLKSQKVFVQFTDATVRETSEETGYPCKFLPLDLTTRAPEAGAQTADAAMAVGGSEEPFMVTLCRTKEGGMQILYSHGSRRCARQARV